MMVMSLLKMIKKNEIGARNFGLLAMEYAKNKNISPTATAKASNETNAKVVFENLPLGYYLVETSTGTACSIDTTHPKSRNKRQACLS